MTLSIIAALLHWGAFGYEMYIAHTYWRKNKSKLPYEPTDTLMLMILLFLSGSVTYSLAVAYFYNPKNKFYKTSTRLVPRVEFKPDGEQEERAPNETDWIYTNIFLLIGTVDVAVMYAADQENVFFDFCGIKDFTNASMEHKSNITDSEKITYRVFVGFLFWALEGGVVVCCVFFVLTRDVIRHIDFTQSLILDNDPNVSTAKRQYLCLVEYTRKITASLQMWFVVHSTLFLLIVLFDLVDLFSPRNLLRRCMDYPILYWVAQTTGSFLIAFKFSFPLLAASRVSRRFDDMLQALNERPDVEHHGNWDSFLSFCERKKAGFTIFGMRITLNVAILSIIFSFVGLLKSSMSYDRFKDPCGLTAALVPRNNSG